LQEWNIPLAQEDPTQPFWTASTFRPGLPGTALPAPVLLAGHACAPAPSAPPPHLLPTPPSLSVQASARDLLLQLQHHKGRQGRGGERRHHAGAGSDARGCRAQRAVQEGRHAGDRPRRHPARRRRRHPGERPARGVSRPRARAWVLKRGAPAWRRISSRCGMPSTGVRGPRSCTTPGGRSTRRCGSLRRAPSSSPTRSCAPRARRHARTPPPSSRSSIRRAGTVRGHGRGRAGPAGAARR